MDILGVQLETPQEIQARIQQTNQAAISRAGGNRAALRSATIQTGLNNVLGSIQSQRAAKDAEELAKSVSARVDALPDNANDEQKLEARLRGSLDFADSRGRTEDSLSINKQLLQLETAKNERARLQASEDLDFEIRQNNLRVGQLRVEELERERDTTDEAKGIVRGLTGDFSNPTVEAFDTNTESGTAELREFLAANPSAVTLDNDQYNELRLEGLKQDPDADRGIADDLTTKFKSDRIKDLESQAGAVRLATNVAEIFRGNVDAASVSTRLAADGNKIINELLSARSVFESSLTPEEKSKNNEAINAFLENSQLADARLGGLAVGIAFMSARADNGSGVLTDKDFNLTAESLQIVDGKFVNNPRVVLQILEDRIIANATDMVTNTELLNTNLFDSHTALVTERIDGFRRIQDSFEVGAPDRDDTAEEVLSRKTTIKTESGAIIGF